MSSWMYEILIGLGLYAIFVALLYGRQARLIFPGRALPASYSWNFAFPHEERWFASQGSRIHSIFCKVESPKGTILFLHGNADELDLWAPLGAALAQATGWNVWTLDYPGYGWSTGQVMSEAQMHRLAQDFYDELLKLPESVRGRGIAINGRSIGSGLAAQLARDLETQGKRVDALILESPYINLRNLISELIPIVPPRLIRFRFTNDENIRQIRAPILLVHGKQDRFIAHIHSEHLITLAKPSDRLLTLHDANHVTITDFAEYGNGIRAFLDEATRA